MLIWPSNIKQTQPSTPISEEPASDFLSSLPPDHCKILVLLQVSTRIILVVGLSPTIEYLYRQPVHGMVHLLPGQAQSVLAHSH